MALDFQFRQRVEAAGGEFLRLESGCVYFRAKASVDDPAPSPIRLFAFACTTEGVRLALKSYYEKLAIDVWESLV
jgi:hypothetical protein